MSFAFQSMTDPIIPAEEIEALRERLYHSFDAYFTRLIEAQEVERERRWRRDYSSHEAYVRSVEPNRQRFLDMLGGWHWERGDLQPRVEVLFETHEYRCERVHIRALDDIVADCLLLTPHGSAPRPAILCQHGLGGSPELACGLTPSRGAGDYNAFGVRMVREGWVVFAPRMLGGYGRLQEVEVYLPPHDMGREAVLRARTRIHRKAMQVGMGLLGAEMFILSRFVDYVQSLATVIPDRIGMYGLSQGGQAALFFPAIDQRIKASVCCAYFNWRMRKQVFTDPLARYVAYIDTTEEDKFFWGHLLEFSDSDVASLIAPRAFMVECGKQDGAVWWEHAQREFEKVRAHYEALGVPERARFALHEGGHECRCDEAFEFLHSWV